MKRITYLRIYLERARRIRFERAWAPETRAALLCRLGRDELIVLNTQLNIVATARLAARAICYTLRDRPTTAALEVDGFYWSSDPRLALLPQAFRDDPLALELATWRSELRQWVKTLFASTAGDAVA